VSEQTTTPVVSGESGDGGEGTATTYGGFASVEELVAAYEAAKAPAEAPPLTVEKTAEGETTEDAQVADALKAAGLNQDDFTKEFAESGDLSEESLVKLEQAGFPRSMTQTYVKGLKAARDDFQNSIYSEAGGANGYKEMIAWAGKTLTENEIAAFNKAVTSGDADVAKLAVSGLAAKHKATVRPSLLNGKGGPGTDGVKPFASVAERRVAMNDPRYRTDPAYRAAVSARLAVSDF